MKQTIEKVYYGFLIAVGVWILYLFISFRLDVIEHVRDGGFQTITDYEVNTYRDKGSPTGVRVEYVFQLNEIGENYNYLTGRR